MTKRPQVSTRALYRTAVRNFSILWIILFCSPCCPVTSACARSADGQSVQNSDQQSACVQTTGDSSPAAPLTKRPNILLIVADDLGWSDVGWHNGFGKTPNMDRLVREGVELDQHYVQPVCTPTRTALMSGRYPGRFGPHALAPSNLRAMPIDTTTLASALKAQGYTTFQSGKWQGPNGGPSSLALIMAMER